MKYVIKVSHDNPEGCRIGEEHWVAENEKQMEALLRIGQDMIYTYVSCLGPVQEPNKHTAGKLAAEMDKEK